MQYIFVLSGILILLGMLVFQVWNFVKYKDTNGHQRRRIFFLLSTLCLIVHEFRLLYGITTGIFLLLHIVFLFFLFDRARVDSFIKWVSGK